MEHETNAMGHNDRDEAGEAKCNGRAGKFRAANGVMGIKQMKESGSAKESFAS